MGDGDAIGEAGADGVVGLADPLLQQPAGADEAAGFLVIGQMQFHRAGERNGRRLQRQSAKA